MKTATANHTKGIIAGCAVLAVVILTGVAQDMRNPDLPQMAKGRC